MEHLIKLHKAQTGVGPDVVPQRDGNQVRFAFHTAAAWCAFIPHTDPLTEFGTIRERLIKIDARVIEHLARIRI
jgi:hypothetical protein